MSRAQEVERALREVREIILRDIDALLSASPSQGERKIVAFGRSDSHWLAECLSRNRNKSPLGNFCDAIERGDHLKEKP